MTKEIIIDVYEDIDSEGIAQDIIKSLTFDLVQPVKVEGDLRFADGEMSIEMSNGDHLEYGYKITEIKDDQYLCINNNVIKIDNDDILYSLRKEYKEYLLTKLKSK